MERSAYRASLTPSDGVREILRTGSGVTLAVMLVLCTVLTFNRYAAQSAAQTAAQFGWLRIVGMVLMSIGALFALADAFLPKGIVTPAIGLFAYAAGGASLAVAAAAELADGYGVLWSIESLLQACAMLGAAVAFVTAALAGSNMRVFLPSAASFASGACTVSLVMLLMRLTVSFSGVYSVGGFSFDYSRADKYSDQLKWIFSTVAPDSATAKDVMLAALLERIALAVVMLCLAIFFSRYAKDIAVFATRLRLLDDIPVHTQTYQKQEMRPEPRPVPVREEPPQEQPAARAQFRPKRSEMPEQPAEPPQEPPAQPARQSGFTPRQRREQPEPQAQRPAQPMRQPPQAVPMQPRAAVKVKIARPTPPPAQPRLQQPQPMDEDSIWNRYAD